MTDGNAVTSARRSVLARESSEVRMATVARWTFVSFYVVSATLSQITMAVLLNYLIAST